MKKRKRNYRLVRTVDRDIEIERRFLWIFWLRVKNKNKAVEHFIDRETALDYLRNVERRINYKEEILDYYTIN
jgi:hypothetical protein